MTAPVRPELKPLLDYLARLVFEELVREASAQPAAVDRQVDGAERQASCENAPSSAES